MNPTLATVVLVAIAVAQPLLAADTVVAPKSDEASPPTSARQPILDAPMDFRVAPVLPPVDAPTPESLEQSIERGVAFLIASQNDDGSWGSADESRPGQVFAPIPGAHHAFKAATTSLCVSALLETEPNDPDALKAVTKAGQWLEDRLPRLKRATGDAIYNVWGHIYAVQALVRLHERSGQSHEERAKYEKLIRDQLDMLDRYESVDGGWGYYDFRGQARKPTSDSISFVNAAALIAMKEAEAIGVSLTTRTVERAIAATERQQKKDFSFLYGEYLKEMPMREVNRPAGSLGRSQACNAALKMWGDEKITDNVLKNWLYRLYVRNGWLSIGRKRPIPHESWFQVAGYFYYFGHYYAGYCVELLPKEDRPEYQAWLARIIIDHQEKDGSWWDYPIYGYYKAYGTAYALMTLARCRAGAKPMVRVP